MQIGYTFNQLYLTLAMVEDPNPPAYEPLSTDDGESTATLTGDGPAPEPAKPITSSLRATSALLRSIGGWRGNFRGIWCAFSLAILSTIATAIFGAFTFPWIGTLLASLLLVQLATAWTTIVISQPSPRSFLRRLPPLRKTFEATCFPVLINWLAQTVALGIPMLLTDLLKIQRWDPQQPNKVPAYNGHTSWKVLILLIVSVALQAFLVIPSKVVLTRVQASLLPPEEDAIIPFDRSFEGTVEPAIVGGKGFVTMKNAFKTFSRASWIRLYKLYVKIFLASMAIYAAFFAVMLVIFIAVITTTPGKDGDGEI